MNTLLADGTDTDAYFDSIKKASAETGVAVEDFSEAVYQAISASVDQADAVAFTQEAIKLTEDGKKYPPKYVIAVAANIANGEDISTDKFNTVEANNYLQGLGFTIEIKQEKFELTISAERIISTDERFTMDNINLGDNYKPLGAYFRKANGEEIKRAYSKGERRNSNQTLPRIACQVFEKQLASMSVEEKESFPNIPY